MNTNRTKSIMWWVFSLIFMLSVAVYQRMTGPTYPARGSVEIENVKYKYKLLRSSNNDKDARVEIEVTEGITGFFKHKRYKSYDVWSVTDMQREGDVLVAYIPKQPAAGKVEYLITLVKNDKVYSLTADPVIIRFKGVVPDFVLVPHVIFMFLAMVFSIRAGIEAIRKGNRLFNQTQSTVIFLFIGGLILGPIVQKYAFDAYWTGWPLGHDLTDNKTIAAFIFWAIALFQVMKKRPKANIWVVVASIVMLAVYLIPHSVLGSEIDYTQMPNQ